MEQIKDSLVSLIFQIRLWQLSLHDVHRHKLSFSSDIRREFVTKDQRQIFRLKRIWIQ